ncbi:MAG: PQQ-binding-like beta-propeller repeat protein [Phycisphaerae bacterium]
MRSSLLLAPALFVATAPLRAQAPAAGQDRPMLATLPESNEALLLSARVEDALDAGDFRLAIELVDQLLRLPPALVGAPASRTYFPLWRQAARLLERFPPEGARVYRQLYDAEVAARFDEARRPPNIDALRALFRHCRLASAWSEIGYECADLLLDTDRTAEAAEVLNDLLRANPADWRAELRLAVASGLNGDIDSAARLIDAAERDGARGAGPEWVERVDRVKDWIQSQPGRADRDRRRSFRPELRPPAAWFYTCGVDAGGSGGEEQLEQLAATRRLPAGEAIAGNDRVYFRHAGQVHAVSTLSLVPSWDAREVPATSDATGAARLLPGVASPKAARGVTRRLAHALALGGDRLFTIEGLGDAAPGIDEFLHRPFRTVLEDVARNELVARDARNGALLWRSGADPSDPLYDVAHQDRPLLVERGLATAFARQGALLVGLIDPGTGRLLEQVEIIGPPTSFADEGGRCLLASDATSIYVSTGNGVIAALNVSDLSWKWAYVYPSTLAQQRGRLWWQPAEEPVEYDAERPIVAGDVLVVAAADSPEIVALDRIDGRERWRMPRGEYTFIVGAVERGLVVGSHALACLPLDDPDSQPAVWRSVPLALTGRPAIRDDRIYAPTREGIVALDGRTGKIIDDGTRDASGGSASAGAQSGALASVSLVVTPEALLSVGSGTVTSYPDVAALRTRCDRLLSQEPAPQELALSLAWLDALRGAYGEALARLDGLKSAPAPLADARDQLYTQLFVALSRAAADPLGRLDWLQRAIERSHSPMVTQRLELLAARAVEQSGDVAGAAGRYLELLAEPDLVLLPDEADPARRRAGWVAAAEELARVFSGLTVSEAAKLVDAALDRVHGTPAEALFLARLRLAASGDDVRRRIDAAWLLTNPRPELAELRLDATENAGATPDAQRRLLLARWDTHVSLAHLAAARQDRGEWTRRYGAPAELPAELHEQVESIELATRKLEQSEMPPFNELPSRQWRLEHAELIVDLARPERSARPWLLVRNFEEQQIELRRAVTDGLRLRQSADRLVSPDAPAAEWPGPRERALFAPLDGSGAERPAWPAVIYRDLAVVPVPGGIVGLGLGPERYAGRWRWEAPIPGWQTVPTAFDRLAAAGPEGVCVATRRDRLAMLDWVDGGTRWERVWELASIERIERVGDWLLVADDDQQAWLVDFATGANRRPLGDAPVAPGSVQVVGDCLIVWQDGDVLRLDPATLEPVWRQRADPPQRCVRCESRGWFGWRGRGDPQWHILDAATGEPVIRTPLDNAGDLTALGGDEKHVYTAGLVETLGGEGTTRHVRVCKHDRASGGLVWSHDLRTRVALNETQLSGHPRYIPVLLVREGAGQESGADAESPSIQLVDKMDGALLEPIGIRADYQTRESSCDIYVLVTGSRVIVQAAGNVVAYGNSALGSSP